MQTKGPHFHADAFRQAVIIPFTVKNRQHPLFQKARPAPSVITEADNRKESPCQYVSSGRLATSLAQRSGDRTKDFLMSRNVEKENITIREIRQIVEANINNENLDVPRLCRKVGMSRSSLHRTLKKHTQKSAVQFICAIRLRKAKELLVRSELNIAQIAFEVGFNDPKYFSRVFSTTFHQSPRSFRKDFQKK